MSKLKRSHIESRLHCLEAGQEFTEHIRKMDCQHWGHDWAPDLSNSGPVLQETVDTHGNVRVLSAWRRCMTCGKSVGASFTSTIIGRWRMRRWLWRQERFDWLTWAFRVAVLFLLVAEALR